ncbi:MAG: hypothetical protein J6J31_01535 [Thermoguttaceae bacterium]|nr:hypothetical protein [Thermoguttaceae bacterium]
MHAVHGSTQGFLFRERKKTENTHHSPDARGGIHTTIRMRLNYSTFPFTVNTRNEKDSKKFLRKDPHSIPYVFAACFFFPNYPFYFSIRSIEETQNENLKIKENTKKQGGMLLPKTWNSGKMQIGVE